MTPKLFGLCSPTLPPWIWMGLWLLCLREHSEVIWSPLCRNTFSGGPDCHVRSESTLRSPRCGEATLQDKPRNPVSSPGPPVVTAQLRHLWVSEHPNGLGPSLPAFPDGAPNMLEQGKPSLLKPWPMESVRTWKWWSQASKLGGNAYCSNYN